MKACIGPGVGRSMSARNDDRMKIRRGLRNGQEFWQGQEY